MKHIKITSVDWTDEEIFDLLKQLLKENPDATGFSVYGSMWQIEPEIEIIDID
jgi:hypothetical protein